MLHWGQEQIRLLGSAIAAARAGHPSALQVEGGEGTGKTSLLDELVARADGFQVLDAVALQSAADYPLGIMEQWGVQSHSGGSTAPPFGAQLLNELLDRYAPQGPILLRLDDLQWADPESVDALVWLLQRAAGDRLLVAVSTRPLAIDVHPGWQRWFRSGHVQAITVSGLSADQAIALVRDRQPAITPELARALWRHTGGNPSLLVAILAEYDVSELSGLRRLPVPSSYREHVGSLMRRLDPETATLLRAVAVLHGDGCSLFDAGKLAGVAHPADHAQSLVDLGLVRSRELESGIVLSLAQPLLGSAVLGETPLAELRRLHAAAAGMVEDRDAVFGHRIAAAELHDNSLASELDLWAADLHEWRLHRSAARYLRAASTLSSDPGERQRRWLDSLYESLLAPDVAVARAEAADVEDATDLGRRDLVLGTLARLQGDSRGAIYWFSKQDSDDESAGYATPETWYRIEVLLAWARIQAGEPTELVARSLDRAVAAGPIDHALDGWFLTARGLVALRTRPAAEAWGRVADLPGDPASVPWEQRFELSWRADLGAIFGLLPQAARDLEHVLSLQDEGALVAAAPHHHALLGQTYWLQGDWARAGLHFRLAQDLGSSRAVVAAALAPLLEIGTGALSSADELITRADALLRPNPWLEAVEGLQVVKVARRHADPSSAGRETVYGELRGRVPALLDGQAFTNPLWLAHAALSGTWAGALDEAEGLVGLMSTSCSSGAAWIPAVAHWVSGLIERERGRSDAAAHHLASATSDPHCDLPFYRAHMMVDRASVADEIGDQDTAEGMRAQARELYRRLGAAGYADRVAAMRTVSVNTPQTLTNEFGLTEREQDVLTLLVAGMSYEQIARDLFVSRSTVTHHLNNIYRKTRTGSRHQLTERVSSDPVRFGLSPL
jgi:DNA-binding CsgD family transcriptional regulator